jgi:hypothetical protein
MLHCVALVRMDVSKEHSAFIIRVTRICELGTRNYPRNVFQDVTMFTSDPSARMVAAAAVSRGDIRKGT